MACVAQVVCFGGERVRKDGWGGKPRLFAFLSMGCQHLKVHAKHDIVQYSKKSGRDAEITEFAISMQMHLVALWACFNFWLFFFFCTLKIHFSLPSASLFVSCRRNLSGVLSERESRADPSARRGQRQKTMAPACSTTYFGIRLSKKGKLTFFPAQYVSTWPSSRILTLSLKQ